MTITIISGGQTGVDRAAMDAAIAAGLPVSGRCPAGGWAEDYPDPPGLLADYPMLLPMGSIGIEDRTRANVRDSDATLVITRDEDSPGTSLAQAAAREYGRPLLRVRPEETDRVRSWISGLETTPLRLNVAGPRESEDPGIHALARALMDAVLAPEE